MAYDSNFQFYILTSAKFYRQLGLKNNKNFIVGYKYHHLSNLYTGNMNIGYNSNFVYAGMNFGY